MGTAKSAQGVARAILADLDKATRKMEWADLVPDHKQNIFESVKADLEVLRGQEHFEVSGKFKTDADLKSFVGNIANNFMDVLDESELENDLDTVEAFVAGHIVSFLDLYRVGGVNEVWRRYREFSWDEQMYQDLNGFAQEFNFRASKDYAGAEPAIAAYTRMVEELSQKLDFETDYMPDAGKYIAGLCDVSLYLERVSGENQKPYRNYMLSIYGLG